MGLQARLMSRRCASSRRGVEVETASFHHQLREKMSSSVGNPETTTGGRASISASGAHGHRRIAHQGRDVVVGGLTPVNVVKTRVRPFREAEFDSCRRGFEAATFSISGSTSGSSRRAAPGSYGGERLARARERSILKDNPDVYKAIEGRVARALLTRDAREAKFSSVTAVLRGQRAAINAGLRCGAARPAKGWRTIGPTPHRHRRL